jgi:hypothetical protein
MPFGLNTKSVIVGVLLGAIVVPRVQALVASRMSK